MIFKKLLTLIVCSIPQMIQAEEITVFAASSLKDALGQIVNLWPGDDEVRISYAGSATLAKQIANGAPADIFISASPLWMDWLVENDISLKLRVDRFLSNELVLISHDEERFHIGELPQKLGNDYLAMGLVESVPVGIYGKEALQNLGIWEPISKQIAQADNARSVLTLVANGEARFGIVYASDAKISTKVQIVETFPMESYHQILYPAALLSENESAKSFLSFAIAQTEIFADYGFIPLSNESLTPGS